MQYLSHLTRRWILIFDVRSCMYIRLTWTVVSRFFRISAATATAAVSRVPPPPCIGYVCDTGEDDDGS